MYYTHKGEWLKLRLYMSVFVSTGVLSTRTSFEQWHMYTTVCV